LDCKTRKRKRRKEEVVEGGKGISESLLLFFSTGLHIDQHIQPYHIIIK